MASLAPRQAASEPDATGSDGALPLEVVTTNPALGGDVPPGDWHQYGLTAFGQRYSPLDQITTDYVAGADLRTGEIAYRYKNGTVRDLPPIPLPFKVGVPGIGGPIVTKGGVAFLGAAVDDYLRAYDLTTDRQLWEARLPAGGQSTPMTYVVNDKQYVLIVAGGHGSIGTKPGD